jgi:hypothetical protein
VTFGKKGRSINADDWKKKGFDANSELREGLPKGAKVFVRPNKYEPGRANILIYNWDKAPSVPVDLKGVLKEGQRFRVVNARNFYGATVASGTYQGTPVSIPMSAMTPAQPSGMPDYKLPVTEPLFGAFVVLRGSD